MKQLLIPIAAVLSVLTHAANADPEKRNTVIRKPATAQVTQSETAQPRADDKIVVAEGDRQPKPAPNGPWKPRKD